ncbi:uncharacterized protein LOC124144841 [Haliotis rufescens]|uniref:uncharacterized protein LOC124144841 n=1 Tax=Haliotis rufescens TaxID=6454 RepID=UPI00201E9F94|nr:uncharacterized protein LOC124144841 [Haliotis rufescens]
MKMMYRALLCLALVVGSVSAMESWFSNNKMTECGDFQIQTKGRLSSKPMTDVDTRQLLADIKAFDTNKDGYVTSAETRDPTVAATFDSDLNLTAGVDRCTFVMMAKKRYDISTGVAARLFDLQDSNNDLMITVADQDAAAFKLLDKDGDGQVSVCEAFKGFMASLEDLENKVYTTELKYSNIAYKYRKPPPTS